jgi:hypothetical protein
VEEYEKKMLEITVLMDELNLKLEQADKEYA